MLYNNIIDAKFIKEELGKPFMADPPYNFPGRTVVGTIRQVYFLGSGAGCVRAKRTICSKKFNNTGWTTFLVRAGNKCEVI
jgi:hypothetical protein